MTPPIKFSQRIPLDLSPSALHVAADATADLIDLTASNPTTCDFVYPPEVLTALASPTAATYVPEALGSRSARAALAAYLGELGQPVPPEHLVLTASTSEAYGMLMKMLCNPGEAIAIGAPSYPLVQHLAELEGVTTRTYALTYVGGAWRLDLDSVEAALVAGVKALVLISPNNPTGTVLAPAELTALAGLCGAHGVPLILDDVFAPYSFTAAPPQAGTAAQCATLAGTALPLCFVLNGLSKTVGLPQHKLGWIAVYGAAPWVSAALARLEWIADAYLSVGAPIQAALPTLLGLAPALQAQICQRIRANRQALAAYLTPLPALELATATAGWYAALRVPHVMPDDALALTLLQRGGAILHPGYFYDFAEAGWLVSGLLLPPARFVAGWQRLLPTLTELFG